MHNESLRQARQIAQERIHSLAYSPYANPLNSGANAQVQEALNPYVQGEVPHSAAALDYLRVVDEERQIMMDRALKL